MAAWQMHRPRARCTVGPEVGDESVPSDSRPALLAKGRASEWMHLLSAWPSLVPLEKDVPYGGCRGDGGAVSCARVFFTSAAPSPHPPGAAFVLPLICGRKTGSAASPSRYGGRPEAGPDSRDTRL